MRISDWSSDVCSSDLAFGVGLIQNGVDLVETKLAARAVAPLAVSDDVAAVRCWRDDDGLQQAAVLDGRGQCINLGLVELPANLRGVWINVSERKALKPPSCLELGIRGDGRKIHRVHIEFGKALLRRFACCLPHPASLSA